jgi:hypothetical protein
VITVVIAPGPASVGIPSGMIPTSDWTSASSSSVSVVFARPARGEHVRPDPDEEDPPRDPEGVGRDAEEAEDPRPERAEDDQHGDRGRDRHLKRRPAVARVVVRGRRQEERDRAQRVHDREQRRERQEREGQLVAAHGPHPLREPRAARVLPDPGSPLVVTRRHQATTSVCPTRGTSKAGRPT